MVARRGGRTPVYLELGKQRVFASALDWPGWSRSGKGEAAALEALAAYARRYVEVAKAAAMPFPSVTVDDFEIVERVRGSATDFGVPAEPAARDAQPVTAKEAARLAGLVGAAWKVFDRVVAKSPASLRKGPRGGGRDRDVMVDHVLGAEAMAYARKLGLRLEQPSRLDKTAIAAERRAILDAIAGAGRKAVPEKGWPAPYAARRIAWHALDHAWEMEDRSQPAPAPPK